MPQKQQKYQSRLWKSRELFDIDFAAYSLKDHHFPRHFHDHFVIELVLKGADSFYCNGKNFTALEGDLVLINPGEVHTGNTLCGQALNYFCLYPKPEVMASIGMMIGEPLIPDFRFEKTLVSSAIVRNKMTHLHQLLDREDEVALKEEVFLELMVLLLNVQSKCSILNDQSGRDPRVGIVIDMIRTHFREEISLASMAAQVHLTSFHLLRLFKKATGITPYEYLLVTRNEFAKQLLCKGYKVNEAAVLSGFYDGAHFNRSFKKINAFSPKFFRPA